MGIQNCYLISLVAPSSSMGSVRVRALSEAKTEAKTPGTGAGLDLGFRLISNDQLRIVKLLQAWTVAHLSRTSSGNHLIWTFLT